MSHANSLGNVVPYGKVTGLPRYLVKKVNLANPLGGIKPADLFRPLALAYEDGYADGRTYGPTGKFIPSHYEQEHITQYAAGFKAGCRVKEHTDSLTEALFSTPSSTSQEARVESAEIP